MLCALIQDNIVIDQQELPDELAIQELLKTHQFVNIIDGLDPVPQVGWTFDGQKYIDPHGIAKPKRFITKEKFLSRFTDDEICNIEDFSKTASPYAKAIRASLKRQEQAKYIDLDYQRTIDGIGALVALTLLTPQRANAILNTPLTEDEKY